MADVAHHAQERVNQMGGRDVRADGSAPVCAQLGVDYWEPTVTDRVNADGVWRTLRWLLGVEGQAAPLSLPVRNADGTTPTAEELSARAVAADPFPAEVPEQRAALRLRVEAEARRSRLLVELIEDTQRNR